MLVSVKKLSLNCCAALLVGCEATSFYKSIKDHALDGYEISSEVQIQGLEKYSSKFTKLGSKQSSKLK